MDSDKLSLETCSKLKEKGLSFHDTDYWWVKVGTNSDYVLERSNVAFPKGSLVDCVPCPSAEDLFQRFVNIEMVINKSNYNDNKVTISLTHLPYQSGSHIHEVVEVFSTSLSELLAGLLIWLNRNK